MRVVCCKQEIPQSRHLGARRPSGLKRFPQFSYRISGGTLITTVSSTSTGDGQSCTRRGTIPENITAGRKDVRASGHARGCGFRANASINLIRVRIWRHDSSGKGRQGGGRGAVFTREWSSVLPLDCIQRARSCRRTKSQKTFRSAFLLGACGFYITPS